MKINRPVFHMDAVEPKFKLVRESDGLTHHSVGIQWIEWNKDGTMKAHHDTPAIGFSLLMSPFNRYYTWLTTSITEIIEEREGYIKFKTLNSNYELFNTNKNNNNDDKS